MAIRNILHFPDSRLKHKALPVEKIDQEILTLLDDMVETMHDAKGVGLAATQIGIDKRLVVMDHSRKCNDPMYFINPEIIHREGEALMEEGCLSVPGPYDKVKRAVKVTFRYLDREGKSHEVVAEDLLAHCIQHEVHHLDGILFIDCLSSIKRQRAIEKMIQRRRSIL